MRGLIATGHTTQAAEIALAAAERRLIRPGQEDVIELELRVQDIQTWPTLFQPRIFWGGARETDTQFADKLKRRKSIVEELDPVVVLKLGADTEHVTWMDIEAGKVTEDTPAAGWVIVDGHHRLEAYRREDKQQSIKCSWFGGSIREAMDVSVQRNNLLKLDMTSTERHEAAWKRVLIGGWTGSRYVRHALSARTPSHSCGRWFTATTTRAIGRRTQRGSART